MPAYNPGMPDLMNPAPPSDGMASVKNRKKTMESSLMYMPLHASLQRALSVMLLALILGALPPLASASDMPGMGSASSSSSKSEGGNVPPDVENALSLLLGAIPKGSANPDRQNLLPLLDFVTSDVNTAKVKPQKRDHGSGAFTRSTLNLPLNTVLRYCFDPDIPGEALYPNVLRRSYWLPGSEILSRKPPLWDAEESLTDDSAPIFLRGAEFEEITPDAFSGCYYSYTLDRLLILMRVQGKAVLISATKQRAPSSVGKVGAIVGKDSDWNYVYSKVVGSNIKLASWAETYMYDSANVTVFFEDKPNGPSTQVAFFKYVRAGWANMNMVKASHIADGSKRFVEGMRQVLESPRLPGAESIAAHARQLRGMDAAALRKALGPYDAGLAAQAGKGSLSSSDFKKLVQEGSYTQGLDQQEMGSELLKQFMKEKLGKPALDAKPQ